ncbi:MAG: hypothetical protein ACP5LP_03075 [Candidatus Micrarchaeia archaeon]
MGESEVDHKETTELQKYMETSQKMMMDILKYYLQDQRTKALPIMEKYNDRVDEASPYFVAALVLFISGKGIVKAAMSRILSSAGIEIDRNILNDIGTIHNSAQMVYILGILLITSAEKEVTTENLINIAVSLGVDPDLEMAKEAERIYNSFALKYNRPLCWALKV